MDPTHQNGPGGPKRGGGRSVKIITQNWEMLHYKKNICRLIFHCLIEDTLKFILQFMVLKPCSHWTIGNCDLFSASNGLHRSWWRRSRIMWTLQLSPVKLLVTIRGIAFAIRQTKHSVSGPLHGRRPKWPLLLVSRSFSLYLTFIACGCATFST